jgi:hypothetical protein
LFSFCVDICPVCFFCPCSVCSPFDSTLLTCRLYSGVNLFVVTICWSVVLGSHKLLLFGLAELFLEDTEVSSFVLVCSPHVYFVVVFVGNYLCRILMIVLADSNSSSTSLSWDSYALLFLQIYSLILSLINGNT